jgi:prophage regulatory protein
MPRSIGTSTAAIAASAMPNTPAAVANANRTAIGHSRAPLPIDRLIGIEEVMYTTSLGRTSIYQLIKEGQFPAQHKVRGRSLWLASGIQAWIQAVTVTDSKVPDS